MSQSVEWGARPRHLGRWGIVVTYAIAMAWVESAVVFYLRTMLNRIDPYQTRPLPMIGGLGEAELIREAATLIMLLTVGMLAGGRWRQRLGYSAIAFGVWDIFYYVFLKVLCGWPHSLLDWDVLFLIPLPWWGPVLAPMSIATVMIVWGTLITCWEQFPFRSEWRAWILNAVGIGIALGVFMADAARVASQGAEAVRDVLPTSFHWSWFCLALGLMAAPAVHLLWHLWRSERAAAIPALAPVENELKASDTHAPAGGPLG